MDFVLPISGVEIALWLPPLIAFAISFFTSMAGVSGAFLLLPFQMSVLGFVSPPVPPTNLVFNVTAIPSGVYRYLRERRLVWPLTVAVVAGTLPGVVIGGFVRLQGVRRICPVIHRPAPAPGRGACPKGGPDGRGRLCHTGARLEC